MKFLEFVEEYWARVDPGSPFRKNQDSVGLCENLEDLYLNKRAPFAMHVPNGTGKSMIANVFWPAWIWGPCDDAKARFLSVSYSQSTGFRDLRRFRILCERTQALWPNVEIRPSPTIARLQNQAGGSRTVIHFGGMTGHICDHLILDDVVIPPAPDTEERKNQIKDTFENLKTRINPGGSLLIIETGPGLIGALNEPQS